MALRVGQKVVCIDEELRPYLPDVYTVSATWSAYDWRGKLCPGILLAEVDIALFVRHFDRIAGPQTCFAADAFRPVVEPKTDISVFHKLLDKINQGHRELVE